MMTDAQIIRVWSDKFAGDGDRGIIEFAHYMREMTESDTKRLDFLEKFSVIAKHGQSIRSAIDQAMERSK
jgi:hypothetical protein